MVRGCGRDPAEAGIDWVGGGSGTAGGREAMLAEE